MGQEVKTVIAENLLKLMKMAGSKNPTAFSKVAGVDQKTVCRILDGEMSPTITVVEKIAIKFGLQAWQLLLPGLDPTNPPVFALTETERNLYEKLGDIAKEVSETQRAYHS